MNEDDGNQGVVYWVDATSDGLMARKQQPHGDDYDMTQLKFDGKIFK